MSYPGARVVPTLTKTLRVSGPGVLNKAPFFYFFFFSFFHIGSMRRGFFDNFRVATKSEIIGILQKKVNYDCSELIASLCIANRTAHGVAEHLGLLDGRGGPWGSVGIYGIPWAGPRRFGLRYVGTSEPGVLLH